MNLQEITTAVDEGKIVRWSNGAYQVINGGKAGYLIRSYNGHCIGLTWADNITLTGKEEEFYIEESTKVGEPENEETDLFEHTENLPSEVLQVIDKYANLIDLSYTECEEFLNELEPLGYSFEYGLDAEPCNLTKIKK